MIFFIFVSFRFAKKLALEVGGNHLEIHGKDKQLLKMYDLK